MARRSRSTVEDAYDNAREENYGNDEEATAPRRGRTRAAEDSAGENDSPRRGRSDRSSRRNEDKEEEVGEGVVTRGWGGYRAKAASTAKAFANEFKVDDEKILMKFLEDDPFASYNEHWIKELKRKSYVCLGVGSCPLCDDLGDNKTRTIVMMNVVDLNEQEPTVKVWRAGPGVAKEIEKRANPAAKSSPLSDPNNYFEVSRAKAKNGVFEYTLDYIKARDLEEDWDMSPLTSGELEEMKAKMYDQSIVKVDTRRELQQIADELLNDER